MTESSKLKKGFFWLITGAIVQNLSKIFIIGILSRLLNSDAFGVATVAATVVGVTELFTQISLGKSLVQLKEITDAHIKVAFTFSIISSSLLTVLFILFINPFVSKFFDYPDLVEVLNVLAFLFPVRGFSQLSFALLQRNKDFKNLAGLEAIAYVIGYGFFATILAWLGFKVWALVYGSLVIAVVYAILLYRKLKFPLTLGFDRQSFNDLFSFGLKYSLIKIVNYGALKGDYLVVGKILGASSLGIYSRGYTLMDSVNTIFGKVLYTVLFPFFTDSGVANERKAGLILKIIEITFNIVMPLSAICFLYSDYIIRILLGDSWLDAVLVFRILAISMFARVAYKVISSFLMGSNTINGNLLVQSLFFILIVTGTYFGSVNFGLMGASVAVSITLYIVFFLFLFLMLRTGAGIDLLSIFTASKKGVSLTVILVFYNYILKSFLAVFKIHFLLECCGIAILNFLLLIFIYLFFSKYFLESSLANMIQKLVHKVFTFRK